MIVLSSATTGLLDDNALETSGSTWRRLLEDVGRRHDELWCCRKSATLDAGNAVLNADIRFQTCDGKPETNIREAADVILISCCWADVVPFDLF